MMTLRFQIIIACVLFIGFVMLVNLIRKRKLELKYAITWLLLVVGTALIVFIPGFLDWVARVLGIYDVTNMVFFVGFIFSIIIIFSLTIALSRNSDRVRKLAQMMALSEYEDRQKKD